MCPRPSIGYPPTGGMVRGCRAGGGGERGPLACHEHPDGTRSYRSQFWLVIQGLAALPLLLILYVFLIWWRWRDPVTFKAFEDRYG